MYQKYNYFFLSYGFKKAAYHYAAFLSLYVKYSILELLKLVFISLVI